MRHPEFSVIIGDAGELLRDFPENHFHAIITSPPCWGLRDCEHPGQIGTEDSLAAYVAALADIGTDLHRVLHPAGTLWLNLGDSYNAYNGGSGPGTGFSKGRQTENRPSLPTGYGLRSKEHKPKDLLGIPWHVAFALQAARWYLRSEIIWHNPHPTPESVEDRPTKSHEQVFLLSKSEDYFYDAAAIAEPATGVPATPAEPTRLGPNKRDRPDVWTIPTEHNPGQHAARMPLELAALCVRAGTPTGGACSHCQQPFIAWHRNAAETIYQPQCNCGSGAIPARILDPFAGSGTTGLAAASEGRDATLLEINPDFARIAADRCKTTLPFRFR